MTTPLFRSFATIADFVYRLFNMMKRRTSKRFVLGDNEEQPSWDIDDSTEVLPDIQKFQMTLETEPESEKEDSNVQTSSKGLLRPPNQTLQ